MALTKRELLLLLLYTSTRTYDGRPVVFGATRLQKLVFLAVRESDLICEACPQPYEFVPYDYGPYSSDLNQDLQDLMEIGWIDGRQAEATKFEPNDLSYEYLTSFMKSRPKAADRYILKGPAVYEAVAALHRLETDGIDTAALLKEFRTLHERFDTMNLDELLKFVYSKYRIMAVNTRRPELLGDADAEDLNDDDWDEEDEHDS